MQLSKIEGFSAVIGVLITFVAGASYIVVLRDDVNDLDKDITSLKNEKLNRDKEFKALKEGIYLKIKDQTEKYNKEKNELEALKVILEKKYKNKKDYENFSAGELIDEARDDFNSGKYSLSYTKFEKALEIYPKNIDILLYLSKAYRMSGDRKKSFKLIKNAIEIDDSNVDVLYEIALINEIRGNNKRALDYLIKAENINPLEGKLYYRLSVNFSGIGEYEKALIYAEKHVKNYPNNYSAYDLRGDINFSLGSYKKAIDDFEYAILLANIRGANVDHIKPKIIRAKTKFKEVNS